MNYKVAKTMLILCIIYLLSFYILKFIFPEVLVQAITSPTLLRFGEVLDSWKGSKYVVNLICTFITFYLFMCASRGLFKITFNQFLIILLLDIINNVVLEFAEEFYTHTSITSMFLLALICKGNLLYSTISFGLHGYLSQFLFSIKGFETIIMHYNLLSGIVLGLEVYFWLILLAIIFNIKEKNKNGRNCTTVSKQAD